MIPFPTSLPEELGARISEGMRARSIVQEAPRASRPSSKARRDPPTAAACFAGCLARTSFRLSRLMNVAG
jgi:hypothetical protein